MSKQLVSFHVMKAVEDEYVKRGESDSVFAAYLTTKLGATVSTARVRQARIVLGVPSNAQQRVPSNVARLKELGAWAASILEVSNMAEDFTLEEEAKLRELEALCV